MRLPVRLRLPAVKCHDASRPASAKGGGELVRSGVPCWVDLSSPDTVATAAFYTDLFGWTARPSADPDYLDFYAGDAHVAAAGPLTDAEQPVSWTTYVATDDADAVANLVLRNGGTMLMAPTPVCDNARLALFVDPTGAPFGAWQPTRPAPTFATPATPSASMCTATTSTTTNGVDQNRHGTLAWNELTTRDPQRAGSFYHQVFGWNAAADRAYGVAEHTTWLLGGQPIGGMITMSDQRRRAQARWTVYFAVDDCDAAALRAQQLGGAVSVRPINTAAGRFALVRDPHGAMFSLLSPPSARHEPT